MKIVNLGLQSYVQTWTAMKNFTHQRDETSEDELWIVEHPSVFTQGIAGKPEYLLFSSDIAVVKTDRGGQITYHGPGQLLIYLLWDLKRLGLGVKQTVALMQSCILELLKNYNIQGQLQAGAPGVYVDDAKIAALGLKVKQGKMYHGLSLNIDMDLSPFKLINPCGYQGLKVTQLSNLTDNSNFKNIAHELTDILIKHVTRS